MKVEYCIEVDSRIADKLVELAQADDCPCELTWLRNHIIKLAESKPFYFESKILLSDRDEG